MSEQIVIGPGAVPQYQYAATIDRWVDGDTVDLTVDVGFYTTINARFRSYGINTPERGQPGYQEAIDFCNQHAPAGTQIVVKTFKPTDKYGRFVAIYQLADGTTINQMLLDANLAVPYYGGTK